MSDTTVTTRRTMRQILADMSAKQRKLYKLSGEVVDLERAHEQMTTRGEMVPAGQSERLANLQRGAVKLHEDIEADRAELALAAVDLEETNAIERGADVEAPNVIRRSDPYADDVTRLAPAEAVERAKAAIAATHERAGLPDEGVERVDGLLRSGIGGEMARASAWTLAASDPNYELAFTKLVQDPLRGHLGFTEAERVAFSRAEEIQRAMTVGTDTAGGALAPFILDPSIILTSNGSVNPVRRVARVVTTTSKTWNGVTSAGVTASWDAEAAEVSDDSPTLAEVQIDVHKGAAFVPFSLELGMDGLDFYREMSRLLVDSIDQLQATAHVTGSGSGQPQGFETGLDGTASELSPVTTEVFAAADVYDVLEAVPPRFRANASWLANVGTINDIAQFETSNGARLFPSVDDGRLLMKPLNECSNMDSSGDINAAATADNFILACGDWRQGYILVDRIGTTIELIPHLFGTGSNRPTGQRGLYCYFRHGAEVVNTAALRLLNIATTA